MRTIPHLAVQLIAGALLLAGCHPTPQLSPAPSTEADVAARRAIANERTIDTAALSPRTVGVLPLRLGTSDTTLAPLAYGLADLLVTDLARSARLQVVERRNLDALLRELKMADAGAVDTATAPRVGRLVGARRLVLGVLTQRADSQLRVDARVADVPTAALQRSVSATGTVDGILDAEKTLAFSLFDELRVNLTPAERAAVEQRPTRNIAALLAYSRAVRDEAFARYADARREYAQAVKLDPKFALARKHLADLGRTASSATNAQLRAALAASDGVNRSFISSVASAADPAFTAADLVTVVVTITSAP